MIDSLLIFPLGESALTIDFGNEISVDLNDKAITLAEWFQANPFPGFIEAVPAYSSIAIFFDLVTVRKHFPEFDTAFEAVRSLALASIGTAHADRHQSRRHVEIPVDFGSDAALDMDVLIQHSGLTKSEVIEIFTSATYRVFMLGFLPGFAYMGEVDERIAIPRRPSPRLKVPKGSVAIAGRQTGVYPLESPGGWQIVGRTELDLFTPHANDLCLLRAGDLVTFRPASP